MRTLRLVTCRIINNFDPAREVNIPEIKGMMKQAPRTITFSSFAEDTVPVKDSAVYQIEQWNFLVKRNRGESELITWLDELAAQGWELIGGQSVKLGVYIFKKPV